MIFCALPAQVDLVSKEQNTFHGLEGKRSPLEELSPQEQLRLRWQAAPRQVAQSMAFARQPVDQAELEKEHALRHLPQVKLEPAAGD